jgi:tetratricopeptide (TPR) repeat protein
MTRVRCLVFFSLAVLFVGCGPDTIFVRPGLDTPNQHVSNGHQLLQRGKVEDACREFKRAQELDPQFVEAYVGLGVALGRKGEFAAGLASLDQARQMASTPQEISQVRKGYEQLDEIKRKSVSP